MNTGFRLKIIEYAGNIRDFNQKNKKRFGKNEPGRAGKRAFERFDSGDSGGRSGKRDFERRIMHEAICDRCGKKCEVPFKPSGNKPVYCSDCFKKNEYSESKGKPVLSSRELEEINSKLDRILNALNIR